MYNNIRVRRQFIVPKVRFAFSKGNFKCNSACYSLSGTEIVRAGFNDYEEPTGRIRTTRGSHIRIRTAS